jgi:hypothetical protein
MIVETPHTNLPDALENARKAGTAGGLKLFTDKLVLSDGKQTLELHAITGNPHVEPKVIAYVPRVLRAAYLAESDARRCSDRSERRDGGQQLLRPIPLPRLEYAQHRYLYLVIHPGPGRQS